MALTSTQSVQNDVDVRDVLLPRAAERQGGRMLVKAIAVDRLPMNSTSR
jgi:hypothetical protein